MTARRVRGFSLLSAIFILVILAVVGSLLVNVSAVQHATFTQQVGGARAYYAAISALEWATYKAAVTPGGCPAGTTEFALAGGAVDGHTVRTQCTRTEHAVPAGLVAAYDVTVTAQAGAYGALDFSSRELRATVIGP